MKTGQLQDDQQATKKNPDIIGQGLFPSPPPRHSNTLDFEWLIG
jgi:hypothetical protein